MRAPPAAYRALDLRAHDLFADLPLHDVWVVELRGGWDRGMEDARRLALGADPASVSPAVRGLFALRRGLGRVFGLDRPAAREAAPEASRSLRSRIGGADRERSLEAPGTRDGPFELLYLHERECAYEAVNATVHAILVVALQPTDSGQRLFWATYVMPVGPITRLYMGLIDPFRHRIVYPGLERWLVRRWSGA